MRTTVNLDPKVHKMLRDFCKKKGYKVGAYVDNLLKATLKTSNNEK